MIHIEYKNNNGDIIKIDKTRSRITAYINDIRTLSIDEYLPKKLVAIYSGEEDRLWRKCYEPFYKKFVREINKSIRESNIYLQTPQMLYLDKQYWHISLLSLAVSDLEINHNLIKENNQDFIKNALGIKNIDKVKFDFEDKTKYKSYSNSPTLEFIRAIDSKSEYTIDELKEIFERENYIADDVYKHLYLAFTSEGSKIIRDIKIIFNDYLTIEDLSEGEKKLLLIKAAFEFAEQEDSLFILDEPDAHVHLNNKELIVKTFEPYKKNRQIILTTHSPTVTQCVAENELYMVDKGHVISRKKQEIISDLTDEFWNKQEQNVFLVNKKNTILLVEGKYDKIHLENAFNKLKDEYEHLDFDIFSLGGEGKIRPFMTGLYETGLKNNVSYIAIYDNDPDGIKSLANQSGFDNEIGNCGYRRLKEDQIKHNNFFAFALTKPDGFSSHCTIENMYDSEKYENAFNEAVKIRTGNFSNHSIDEISKRIKDDSKNILAENSKNFEKEDFKHFRSLFDLILKIKNDCLKIKTKAVETNNDGSENIEITLEENQPPPAKEDKPLLVKENRPVPAKEYQPSPAKINRPLVANEDQPLPAKEKSNQIVFYFKTKGIEAKGIFNESNNSFTLLSDSEVVKECVTATKDSYKKWRINLIKSTKYQESPTAYLIEENLNFDSPSGAAKFVNGGSKNGLTAWKDKDGNTLSEIYDNQAKE